MKRTAKIAGIVLFVLMLSTVLGFALGDGDGYSGYGFLSLIPPLVTIALAFITKETVISMFAGIWLGATIIAGWNPIDGLLTGFTDFIVPQIADGWNAGMLVIMIFIGGFMYMIAAAGTTESFGMWAQKTVNTRKKAQIMTWIAPFLFLFNQGCLVIGAIMRPVTDKMKVSRVKLAYITDALGAPLVSMSPISDNGVYLVGLLAAQVATLGLVQSEWSLYFGMFQYNLYGVFSVITVLLVILFNLDFGPMYKAEKLAAETGQVYGEHDNLIASPPDSKMPEGYSLTYKNFAIPMLTLVITILAIIFYTGKVWENGFIGSFTNANIQIAIMLSFLFAAIAAGGVAVKTKLMTPKEAMDKWVSGGAMMTQVILILVMAWSISSVTTAMGIGPYLTSLVRDNISPALVPAIMFAIGIVVSFATGSSWGVFALGIPIAVPMANELGLSIPLAIGAVVSGGLFGDHCSPISDTTIQSSTGACCDHLEHVKTQIPYALLVGTSCLIGYVAAGFVHPMLGLVVTFACIVTALFFIKTFITSKRTA